MSLINEALKRAKQTQQENPPGAPPLEFRPVEAEQKMNRRTALLTVGLVLVIIAILGLGGALVWYVSQNKPEPLPVAARVADAPLAPLPQNPPTPIESVAAKSPVESSTKINEPNTNNVSTAEIAVEQIKPAPPKLQGIFFNPSNPSAVVNGRTVYLGDRMNGFRVMGISPVAVTLVSATETNVLSLSGQ
jgi:hypothetical protein